MGGFRYFLTFMDDYTRKVFVYILKEKSKVAEKLLEFKNFAETQSGKKIKILRVLIMAKNSAMRFC